MSRVCAFAGAAEIVDTETDRSAAVCSMLPGSIFDLLKQSQTPVRLHFLSGECRKGSGGGDFLQIPGKHQAAWRRTRQLQIQMWRVHLQTCALNGLSFVVFPRGCGNARRRGGTVGFRAEMLERWDATPEREAQTSEEDAVVKTVNEEEDLQRSYHCYMSPVSQL